MDGWIYGELMLETHACMLSAKVSGSPLPAGPPPLLRGVNSLEGVWFRGGALGWLGRFNALHSWRAGLLLPLPLLLPPWCCRPLGVHLPPLLGRPITTTDPP
jgi:hypothetical protein